MAAVQAFFSLLLRIIWCEIIISVYWCFTVSIGVWSVISINAYGRNDKVIKRDGVWKTVCNNEDSDDNSHGRGRKMIKKLKGLIEGVI